MFDKSIFKAIFYIKENCPFLYKYFYKELEDKEYLYADKENIELKKKFPNCEFYMGFGPLYIISGHTNIIFVKELYELIDNIDLSNEYFTEEELFYLKLKDII